MEMKYPRCCEFCRKQKTELCEKCGLVHVDPIPVPIPRHFWYAVDDDLTVDVDDITMPVDYSRLVSNDVVNHPSHYQSDSGLGSNRCYRGFYCRFTGHRGSVYCECSQICLPLEEEKWS